jgi:Protein of unknown function (DUF2842)
LRQRIRKLIGTAILAVFVPFYALTAMSIAGARLPGSSGLTQTVFYAIAGLLWVLPAGVVITWMQRPDRRGTEP